MGILDRLRWVSSMVEPGAAAFRVGTELQANAGPAFMVDETAIDPAVFGLTAYASPTAPAPRIDRRSAMQVPAVKRVRDLIAGSIATLPIKQYDAAGREVSSFLAQPERDVPRSVTMARTLEDLLFEAVAWWQVTERYAVPSDFPRFVKRLEPRRVDVKDGKVTFDGKEIPKRDVIRFDSPNDPLLTAGARAIRTCLLLDAAAARYADEPLPAGWFEPSDPDAEPTPAEITEALDAWASARRTRATGYVPAALEYKAPGTFSPSDLQMADARNHAVLEIARAGGVDPEDLGVSTTSRTYQNQFDRRKQFTDFTLGGYMTAVQDRLSMPDTTPVGNSVRFDLDAFYRSDPASQYAAIAAGLQVGAIDPSEVRPMVGRPPLSRPATGITRPQERQAVAASNVTPISRQLGAGDAISFAAGDAMHFDAPGAQTFEVDTERRVIRGLAVPYGVPARSRGRYYRFNKDSLTYADVRRVKLWINHEGAQAVGVMFEATDTPAGKVGAWKIARGPEGDRALTLAEDGVLDGLSVGLADGGTFEQAEDGVLDVVAAQWMETSLTPAPAFDDARVHSVAASHANPKGNPLFTPDELAALRAAGLDPANVDVCQAYLRGRTAPAAAGAALAADPAAVTFSHEQFAQLPQMFTDAITAAGAALARPQATPGTVDPTATTVVREELPYRFVDNHGKFSLIDDLRQMASGNMDARNRLETFMGEVGPDFAVTSANVSALNPTQNRPELYVENLTYTRPLQEAISTGTIDDKTPFTVPKFGSASGLVGAHVEGVEPTPGAFTATAQTVTPTALSGKVEIVREVWDAGGSPQADTIVWGEMVNAWFEAREARIATLLNGLTLTEINLAGAVDAALQTAMQNILIDLQFVRGGNRYTSGVADGLLFKALVNAKDTAGRALFPVLGPMNAQGTVDGAFDRVMLGSQAFRAAWALGATNASNSYLLVPTSFWQWASAPQRFTFEYQVKSIDMAIWGYEANASLRDTDAKRIDYTTADV